jgi:hypothetical protein
VTNFSTASGAHPAGAPRGPPRALSTDADHRAEQVASGRPAVGGRGGRGLAVGRRQPGPPPLARPRTGAGRCRHAVSPAPARLRSPAATHPSVIVPARVSRAVLPRRAILSPRKLPVKGAATAASLRCAPGRPLTASFPGKAGTCREAREGSMGVTVRPVEARSLAGGQRTSAS